MVNPCLAKASAAATDWPPVRAMMPMRSPVEGAMYRRPFSTSTISSRLLTLIAPACRTRDSQTVFSVAREAVCEETARAPSAVCPPFQMTTGLRLHTSLRTSKKRRPSLTPSTYMPTILVSGVLAEVFKVVRDVEDDGVAQAYELADLHAVRAPEQAEVHALGAALADEAYWPGLAGVLLGGEADATAGDEQAHAVGPDQHEVSLAGHLGELVL